jgi:VWFA-related protein
MPFPSLRSIAAASRLAAVLVLLAVPPAGTVPVRAAAAGRQQPPPPQRPQLPRPQYDTRVDLILVDVTVVDGQGRPVEGLTPADFKVWVDGRARRIQTAQFITPSAAEPDMPPPPPAPAVSSNQASARGRTFMLVVDEGNLSMADTRGLDQPLAKFFAGLAPGDRVGLVTIPMGGPRVDCTTDVGRVRRAVARIAGMGSLPTVSQHNVGLVEAFLYDARAPDWAAVVARECGSAGADAKACEMEVEAEARAKVVDARQHAFASLGALEDVIRSLRAIDGPKTLVLVSGGVVLERDDSPSLRLAEEAAAADVSIYVLHLERPGVDASVARPSPTLTQDLALGRQGLEIVAGRTRGEVFNVPTSGEFALARIASETAGYYLLGVDAEEADRNGKGHQVRVELSSARRGLTLRSRREFRVERVVAGKADGERLGALLGAPTTKRDVPLRVSAFSLADSPDGKRRVSIAAEIDDGATAVETALVGFVIRDAEGRERANKGQRVALKPVDPARASPLRYVASLSLEPGEYVLKLGAILSDGRAGSLEHPLTTRLRAAGLLQVSDLFVLDVPAGGSVDLRPEVLTRVTGERAGAYFEVYGADAAAFEGAEITVAIAATEDGEALVGGKVRAGGSEPTRRTVQAALPTDTLAPGSYLLRARVTDRDGVSAYLVRAFVIPERKQ